MDTLLDDDQPIYGRTAKSVHYGGGGYDANNYYENGMGSSGYGNGMGASGYGNGMNASHGGGNMGRSYGSPIYGGNETNGYGIGEYNSGGGYGSGDGYASGGYSGNENYGYNSNVDSFGWDEASGNGGVTMNGLMNGMYTSGTNGMNGTLNGTNGILKVDPDEATRQRKAARDQRRAERRRRQMNKLGADEKEFAEVTTRKNLANQHSKLTRGMHELGRAAFPMMVMDTPLQFEAESESDNDQTQQFDGPASRRSASKGSVANTVETQDDDKSGKKDAKKQRKMALCRIHKHMAHKIQEEKLRTRKDRHNQRKLDLLMVSKLAFTKCDSDTDVKCLDVMPLAQQGLFHKEEGRPTSGGSDGSTNPKSPQSHLPGGLSQLARTFGESRGRGNEGGSGSRGGSKASCRRSSFGSEGAEAQAVRMTKVMQGEQDLGQMGHLVVAIGADLIKQKEMSMVHPLESGNIRELIKVDDRISAEALNEAKYSRPRSSEVQAKQREKERLALLEKEAKLKQMLEKEREDDFSDPYFGDFQKNSFHPFQPNILGFKSTSGNSAEELAAIEKEKQKEDVKLLLPNSIWSSSAWNDRLKEQKAAELDALEREVQKYKIPERPHRIRHTKSYRCESNADLRELSKRS